MKTIEFKLIAAGVLFILSVLSGVWVSNLGKPLNPLFISVHKIIAFLAVIFTGMAMYQLQKDAEIRTAVITLIITAGLSFIALIVTGSLLSVEKLSNNILLVIHRVTAATVVLSAVTAIYILIKGKR